MHYLLRTCTHLQDTRVSMNKFVILQNYKETDINEWMASDKQFEVTDSCVVKIVDEKMEENVEEEMQPEERKISQNEGVTLLEGAMRYVEQQKEAAPTDVILFKCWCGIIAKKQCQLQKQKTLYNFFIKM